MTIKLGLRTQQRANPQLVLTSKLLQLSGPELKQTIAKEAENNPALEFVYQPDRYPAGSSVAPQSYQQRSGDNASIPASSSDRGSNYLAEQVPARLAGVDQLIAEAMLMVDRPEQPIAIYLLYSLDRHGYLRRSPAELADEIGVSVTVVKQVITVLQELDPPGIAARDLRECLLIQCRHLQTTSAEASLAQRILSETWDDFINQRWARIVRKLGVSSEDVVQARQVMSRHLCPYPLHLLDAAPAMDDMFFYVDLIIVRETSSDGICHRLFLPVADAFELRVNADFESLSKSGQEGDLSPAEQVWITEHVNRARAFKTAIQQRWTTLQRIGEYLIDYQAAFLEHGPLHLQPLTRAAVAAALALHESTVGRAIHDKVAQLPDGRLMPLSAFFDDSIVAKEAIKQLLARADEPLNDREVANLLRKDGLNLARRTVTKYRRQLKIPAAHERQYLAALSGY